VPLPRSIRLAALTALLIAPAVRAEAQRRPGVGMGFYTTTGLLTFDLEVGSLNSSTDFAEVPSFSIAGLLVAPVKRAAKRAWIAGARAEMFAYGNNDPCFVPVRGTGCQNVRFRERAMLLTGGAFDIRSSVLRVMVGPALYTVAGSGARIGPSLRLDYGAPRLRGSTPTIFVARTFLGSQRGEAVGVTALGVGFRWVRKQ
jgi:hypothetical protein